jgi:hypothetical protein
MKRDVAQGDRLDGEAIRFRRLASRLVARHPSGSLLRPGVDRDPLQAGSTSAVWGTAAILWAIASVAVAEYSRLGNSITLLQEVPQSN